MVEKFCRWIYWRFDPVKFLKCTHVILQGDVHVTHSTHSDLQNIQVPMVTAES